jgi:hypothetical protein
MNRLRSGGGRGIYSDDSREWLPKLHANDSSSPRMTPARRSASSAAADCETSREA